MPMYNGLTSREGFTADVLARWVSKTVLNPALLLPIILAARYTKKGEDMSILHHKAYSRIKTLFYVGLLRWLNNWHSRRAANNFVSDSYNWRSEIAIVTGGSGGIGGHIAQLLAEKGLTVVVLDIQALTYSAPSNIHFYTCDLTSASTLSKVADQIRKEIGQPTILINNAGVARGKTLLDATEKDIRFTYDVNTLAHFWTAKEFLPYMIQRNHGMVVTVASFASWLNVPNMVDYASSKAAAQSFHEGLAAELVTRYHAPRVRMILVNQGFTKTALFDGYRNDSWFVAPSLHPETVAEAVVRQVLGGQSGQVIVPGLGNILSGIHGWPIWLQHGMRSKYQSLMVNFRGRQVVDDLDGFYKNRDGERGTDESGVLVPEK